MVKNNTGGNKSKKFASKSFNIQNRATRIATEKGELYAIVNKMMGNNICQVLCIDGYERLCVIRGKFLGKGKRDNILSKGKWILVGLREWEVTKKDKEKCDLLEVYNDYDKDKLIKNNKVDFSIFLSMAKESNIDDYDTNIQFTNEDNIIFSDNEEDQEDQEDQDDQEDPDVQDHFNHNDFNQDDQHDFNHNDFIQEDRNDNITNIKESINNMNINIDDI